MQLSMESLSTRISVVSVNFYLQTLTLIQLHFRAFLHGKFACPVIWYFCMRIECASQHYSRTLENINIWDITVVSEHVPS